MTTDTLVLTSQDFAEPAVVDATDDRPVWRDALVTVAGSVVMAVLGASLASYLDLGFAAAGLT